MTRVGVRTQRGGAGEIHALDPFGSGPPATPEVWVCEVTRPAIVLGSRQAPSLLDSGSVAALGLEVVRRRSGGGAVLLRPGAMVWIDVILPHGVAPDDVRGSMIWIGELWSEALAALGAGDGVDLHRGGMVATEWSDLVCFAGYGPGEIGVGGRKLLGLSQRRTRHGLRIQCQVHRRSLLAEMRSLFAGPVPAAEVPAAAVLTDLIEPAPTDAAVASALTAALTRRITT